jgi:hypothetical protein
MQPFFSVGNWYTLYKRGLNVRKDGACRMSEGSSSGVFCSRVQGRAGLQNSGGSNSTSVSLFEEPLSFTSFVELLHQPSAESLEIYDDHFCPQHTCGMIREGSGCTATTKCCTNRAWLSEYPCNADLTPNTLQAVSCTSAAPVSARNQAASFTS